MRSCAPVFAHTLFGSLKRHNSPMSFVHSSQWNIWMRPHCLCACRLRGWNGEREGAKEAERVEKEMEFLFINGMVCKVQFFYRLLFICAHFSLVWYTHTRTHKYISRCLALLPLIVLLTLISQPMLLLSLVIKIFDLFAPIATIQQQKSSPYVIHEHTITANADDDDWKTTGHTRTCRRKKENSKKEKESTKEKPKREKQQQEIDKISEFGRATHRARHGTGARAAA